MRTATVRYTARVCTRASQHVGACIFLFCDMQRTLSADWFWRHLCTCLSLLLRLYSTNPPPHTLPYYPRTKHPRAPCPVSQATTLGRGLPPPIMGARRQNLRLARGSADSGCLRAHRYLHHAPPRPHPASHPHNTLACNHSSLPPSSVLPPPHTHTFQHIIFCEYISPRLCVRFFVKGARTKIDLLACRVCFVKNMMISTQVYHHTHFDLST